MPVTTDPARFDVPDARDLRAMRIIAQLTMQDAATAVGVDIDTIRRWEQGETSPRLCDVQSLISVYRDEFNGQQQLSESP